MVNVVLGEDDIAFADEIAKRLGVSRSAAIRMAIRMSAELLGASRSAAIHVVMGKIGERLDNWALEYSTQLEVAVQAVLRRLRRPPSPQEGDE